MCRLLICRRALLLPQRSSEMKMDTATLCWRGCVLINEAHSSYVKKKNKKLCLVGCLAQIDGLRVMLVVLKQFSQ